MLLGAGGMGEVYRARDTRLGREVALKILPDVFAGDAERLARFEREAKLLASLNHPNIAIVHGLEHTDGHRALVMELVAGEDLSQRIARGPIPVDEALPIASQIAEALEAAHEVGIIHRDLKPANVKVRPNDTVKVLDFGLAKMLSADGSGAADGELTHSPTITSPLHMTTAGMILGTAAYMAPEQARGRAVDRSADLWAFGCVLYEMLTGQPAFQGDDVTEVIAAVVKTEPDWTRLPSSTPNGVRSLLRQCLRKPARQRLCDARAARLALEDASSEPQPAATTAIAHPTMLRNAVGWMTAATIFAMALVGMTVVHFQERPPTHQQFRFQLPVPEGLADIKLSPDGRFLAFSTRESGGNRVWVRELDSLSVRPLASLAPGPSSSTSVTWSPDGKFVAFADLGKIFKVARTGGPPIPICDLASGTLGGASWRDDGTIVLVGREGIFRVSSNEERPTKIYSAQSGRQPVWLSGDRFLLGTSKGIAVFSLDGRMPTTVIPDQSEAAFVPDRGSRTAGQLLFVRGETLMAQPFDAAKVALHGDAVPIAERVGKLRNGSAYAASASGVLVFGSGEGASQLVWVDRKGNKLETVSKPFNLPGNPAIRLSPDESMALIPIVGQSGTDLWIADLKRHNRFKFTFDGASSGIWSPDSRKVLWAANDGNRYLRSADGSGVDELLFKNPRCATCYPYSWSEDGKIAFTEARETLLRDMDIWLVDLKGDHKPVPYVETSFLETWAQIAPNGKWMSYLSTQPGSQEVIVESIPAGNGRKQVSVDGADFPVWRRDGTELFFTSRGKMIAAAIRFTEGAVFVDDLHQLFDLPSGVTRFQVSRDGQRFLFALPVEDSAAAPLLTVDTNWRAALQK
jgi:serine/threonine protein kinase